MLNKEIKLRSFINDFYNDEQDRILNLINTIKNNLNDVKAKGVNGMYNVDGFDIIRPYPCASFGYINEDFLPVVFKDANDFEIKEFPNGPTNFPDCIINNVVFDFKAVKCDVLANSTIGSPKYNNAVHSIFNVKDDLKNYFENGIVSDFVKSFIIYTYYYIDENGRNVFNDFDIIPTICALKSNDNGFAVKHGNANGMQNTNVKIGYNGVNEIETYEECLDRLKKAYKM